MQQQQWPPLPSVALQNEVPQGLMDDVVLVDNSEALQVTAEGEVVLPLEDEFETDGARALEFAPSGTLNPEAPAFDDPSVMDTQEVSHFYANDQTLHSLHSQSLTEEQGSESQVFSKRNLVPILKVADYSKRKIDTSPTSPPSLPVAKRTLGGSPDKPVRQSLVDICLRPARFLRSHGSAPTIPNIPFPVGSRAYRRELEKLEAQNEAKSDDRQNVPSPESPSRP